MALLLEYEFRTLPADKQIDTEPFLEAVTHLPPFFGEWRAPRPPGGAPAGRACSLPSRAGEGRLQSFPSTQQPFRGGQRCSESAEGDLKGGGSRAAVRRGD